MTVLIDEQRPAEFSAAYRQRLRRQAENLLASCGRPGAELSILLIDDPGIAELNQAYRKRTGPTNVLAFPLASGDLMPAGELLGDVVISVDTAAREAARLRISLGDRLLQLLIHGVLHLFGHDHERSEAEAVEMRKRESKLFRKIKAEWSEKMIRLAINVDHVATVRQARGIAEPDPVLAAGICELAGAHGIVVHLREDRRHIQDRDVRLLRQTVRTKLNLEMGAAEEIISIALDIGPDMVTLVPEKRRELTTEGGLNVAGQRKKISETIGRFSRAGIPVSLFVDPDSRQVRAAAETGATFVELHTGRYSDAKTEAETGRELELIAGAAEEAREAGLRVNAGHGLNYLNTARIGVLPSIEELSIGHAVITRAVFVGLDQAVREMLALLP